MKHISLFSGIGGDTLAAQWAGFETVLFVEIDPFCQKVLNKHWPDVPILGDIKDVTKETIPDAGRLFGITESTDGQRGDWEESSCFKTGTGNLYGRRRANTDSPITLITGGFPCQPVSVAGKRQGKEDDRWLWPEMLRVISEVRPAWVVAENVAGLLRMGFRDCISDLESAGYETTSFLIPACAVNAPHRRDRVFIVAHSTGNGCFMGQGGRTSKCVYESGKSSRSSWWAVESAVGRVAHGIPSRVDRLKALGNAIVPQQIYPILKGIADIEGVK